MRDDHLHPNDVSSTGDQRPERPSAAPFARRRYATLRASVRIVTALVTATAIVAGMLAASASAAGAAAPSTSMRFSTFLGGGGGDYGQAMTVDTAGNIIVVGMTWSDMPATFHHGADPDGWQAFVVKYNPAGTQVVWSALLGGAGTDDALDVATDAAGRIYVVGRTESASFPLVSAVQANPGGNADGFLSQLSADGQSLLYSSYVGGNDYDAIEGVAIQPDGTVVLAGGTMSANFPHTANAYRPTHAALGACSGMMNGGITQDKLDGVMVRIKIGAPSSLTYGTFMGGGCYDNFRRVGVDATGNIFLAGYTYSTDYPLVLSESADQPNGDVVVAKFPANGTAPSWAKLWGGDSDDNGWGIAVSPGGDAVVTGKTGSGASFPALNAAQPCGAGVDAFALKVDTNGTRIFSTCLGGAGSDQAAGVAIDPSGNVWIAGNTTSTDIAQVAPITPAQVAPAAPTTQYFLTRLSPTGARQISTYLGGSANEDDPLGGLGTEIATDPAGNAVFAGRTESANYPVLNAADGTFGGGSYPDTVITGLATSTTTATPSLTMAAATAPGTTTSGSAVSQSVKVTNTGTATSTAHTMTLRTTGTVVYERVTVAGVACATTRSCTIPALAPGQSVTVTRRIAVSAPGSMTTSFDDSATVPVTRTATTTVTGIPCTIVGTSNADKLVGTNGNDIICGFEGSDNIKPGAGDDIVRGGTGTDTVNYADRTTGVVVNLAQSSAWDNGGTSIGFDMFESIETASGTSYADTIVGTAAAELIYGNGGKDTVWGYGGNDTIDGGSGNDTLYGGDGDDAINGGNGTDTCAQNAGTGTPTACEA